MYKILAMALLCSSLSGCIGTQATGRDVDTTKAHPTLHSVPDRPKPVNYPEVAVEQKEFETDYSKKMVLNRNIRNQNKPPEKPQQ